MRVVNTWFCELYFSTVRLRTARVQSVFLSVLFCACWCLQARSAALHFRTQSSMAYNLIFFHLVDWFGDLSTKILVSELATEKKEFSEKASFPEIGLALTVCFISLPPVKGKSHKIIQRLQGSPVASSVSFCFSLKHCKKRDISQLGTPWGESAYPFSH